MTRQDGERAWPGGLWLLVPAAWCAWPLPVAGLVTAGALAWAVLGLALSIPLAAAMLLIVRSGKCIRRPARGGARADWGRNDHAV